MIVKFAVWMDQFDINLACEEEEEEYVHEVIDKVFNPELHINCKLMSTIIISVTITEATA